MKQFLLAAGLALAVLPAWTATAQQEPARLPLAAYGSSLAEAGYVGSSHAGHPLHDCQCEHRKGYDLWCQPVGYRFGRKWGSCGCGCSPAPSCCAPEPTCAPPEPMCCAPEPVCAAPEPACCAPEPTCCAPEPTCCAPTTGCGTPRRGGLLAGCKNPLSELHEKIASLFKRKRKSCCQSDCCGDSCGCGCEFPSAPSYIPPVAPETDSDMPETMENPFTDDPPVSIPVPETTTSRTSSRRHAVMQAGYQE